MSTVTERGQAVSGKARWLVAWGLTGQLVVAVVIRLLGHMLLDPDAPVIVFGFFLAVIPLMIFVIYPPNFNTWRESSETVES